MDACLDLWVSQTQTIGVPFLMPGMVKTNCPPLWVNLDQKCIVYTNTRTQETVQAHASCAGNDSKATQSYPDLIVKAIHRAHDENVKVAHSVKLK